MTTTTKEPRYVGLLLGVLALGLNISVLNNEFVYWDDGPFYFQNLNLQAPWDSWDAVKWIFSLEQTVRFTPVSWVILKGIYEIWGLDPTGIRVLALILHISIIMLIYVIAKKIFFHF